MKKLSLFIALVYSSIASAFLPTSFRADFSQEEKSLVSGRVKKSEGSIEYRRPGRIRFEIDKPNKIVFVGNPEKTWYYTAPAIAGEPGQVTVSRGAQHPILKFFDVLGAGLENNKSYTVAKKDGVATLTFQAQAQKDFNLKSAILKTGKDYNFSNLNEIAVTLNDGKTIRLELKKNQANVALPESRFRFEVPANTRTHQQ